MLKKRQFCRHLAMTSHLVIERMRRATLKKLKELSGFLRQKMKQSFLVIFQPAVKLIVLM